MHMCGSLCFQSEILDPFGALGGVCVEATGVRNGPW